MQGAWNEGAWNEEAVARAVAEAIKELCGLTRPDLRPVRLLVVGCSTSEIAGGVIGRASAPDLGRAVAGAALEAARALGVELAFQCCEHLNRALVVERRTMEALRLAQVAAVPHAKAGGSCAAAAFRLMQGPVLVEAILADAGLDIGQTLIGMHLQPVAVPIRLRHASIGGALVTAARTRPKYIGGPRARYDVDEDQSYYNHQQSSINEEE